MYGKLCVIISCYFYNWLVLVSKAFNTMHLGTPHESFSQKVARKVIIEKSGCWYWNVWASIINKIFKQWPFNEENHLADAIDQENRSIDLETFWTRK